MLGERDGDSRHERNALVRRSVQHIEVNPRVDQRRRIKSPEPRQARPGIEPTAVEKIRADTPGLERELTEAQRLARERHIKKVALVIFHARHSTGRDARRKRALSCAPYERSPCASSPST